jgi:hypothetical protein
MGIMESPGKLRKTLIPWVELIHWTLSSTDMIKSCQKLHLGKRSKRTSFYSIRRLMPISRHCTKMLSISTTMRKLLFVRKA